MSLRRKIKAKKIHINKINKKIREMQREKKSKRNCGRKESTFCYSINVKKILAEKWSSTNNFLPKFSGVKRKFEIPQYFTFSDSPEGAIKFLREVFAYGLDLSINELYFDHSKCTKMDLAASTVMDTILLALETYHKKSNSNLRISGYCPPNSPIKDMLLASGIIKHLNADTTLLKSSTSLQLFSLVTGKENSKKSDIVATKLKEYFDRCLRTQGYMLDDAGANHLGKMFGEVINNCEIHGGRHSVWYTLGHYQIVKHEEYGEFHLVIFNYGDSIYERLKSSETTDEIKIILSKMDKVHKAEYNSKWNKETMYTVFSLQEGISRLRDKTVFGNKKRGTGTIRLMESIYAIGMTNSGKKPEFSITSGNTQIIFDNAYKLQRVEVDDEILGKGMRKIMAFNKDSNIYKKADPNNVKIMKEYFPGTIISMKFYLDKKYLSKL